MSKKSPKKRTGKAEQNNANARLPGWPGYRTRDGRSGYDPIDTRTEAAHTAGTLVHVLFSGRTRNPLYLFLLGALGLLLITPFVLAISETRNGHLLPWSGWIFVLILGIAGLAILVNLIRNLIQMVRR